MSSAKRFSVITLFPEMFAALQQEGVIARAIAKKLIHLETVFLRDFSEGERRSVDEHPVGGGDGMVLRPEVVERAILATQTEESFVVCLSPSGKVFNNEMAKMLAQKSHLIFLCGRYAGFDERTVQKYTDIEVSLGDFVLSGGELPSMCVIDTVSRFVPGVLGNALSAQADSFEDGLLEAPTYTKPLDYHGISVPEILLSGDHGKISVWRRRSQIKKTALNRPDLILRLWDELSKSERAFVEKIWKHNDN